MPVFISASHLRVSENDNYAEFTLSLSEASPLAVSVDWDVNYATASSYSDFESSNGTLIFPAGVMAQTIQVPIDNDTTAEGLESFVLELHSAVNAIISNNKVIATIVDNDSEASLVSPANLSVSDAIIDESAGIASFYLTLDRATSNAFSIGYSTAGLSATAGSDYTSAIGTVEFPAGSTVQRVDINIFDDVESEPDEMFQLLLGDISGAGASEVILADGEGTGIIGRSPESAVSQPLISVSPITVSEGDGIAEFVVQLSSASQEIVSATWSLNHLSSSSYTDYDPLSGTLYFASGVTTQVIQVPLDRDTTAESIEAFGVELTSATNALIANDQALATLIDDDRAATYQRPANLSVADLVVDQTTGIATLYLTLDRTTNNSFSVDFTTRSGSALTGSDFTARSGSITFAAGQTVQSLQLEIQNELNLEFENDELFYVDLSNISGPGSSEVVLGNDTASVQIGRNGGDFDSQPVITVNPVMVDEGDGIMEFVVQLSAPSSQNVQVDWELYAASTSAYNDFEDTDGTLIFEPGVTTQKIQIALNDDQTAESQESLELRLLTPVNAQIANNRILGTIIDDDSEADALTPANLSVRDIVVDESSGVATVWLVLDRATSANFSVAYSTSDGTAEAGSDYISQSGTLSFSAGEVVKQIQVDITNDLLAEVEEHFALELGAISGPGSTQVQVADSAAEVRIARSDQADDPQPTLSIDSVMLGENESAATFVIRLSAPTAETVTVNWETDYGTASSSADYNPVSGQLVFAPGTTVQQVQVDIDNNSSVERIESFVVRLSSATNALIQNDLALGTMIDNDAAADTIHQANLTIDDLIVDESTGRATFYLRLDRAVDEAFSLNYQTFDRSALAGEDYTAASGSLTFAAGQMVQSITVDIADDLQPEMEEQFGITLSDLSGSGAADVALADDTGIARIGRSDLTAQDSPVVSATAAMASEQDGYVDILVSLNAPSEQRVSIDWGLYSATASSYSDYDSLSGTLVFAPGVTTQTVRVPISDDTSEEGTESFTFRILSETNAVAGNSEVSVTIVDNDTPADVLSPAHIVINDVSVDESIGVATLFVTLDRATSRPFTLDYTTVAGTAGAGSDYRAISGTLGFAAGDTMQSISIDIVDDNTAEALEQFGLNLSSPAGPGASQVSLSDASATITIGRNDTQANRPTITVEPITVNESDGVAVFTVQLSAASIDTITVDWSTTSIDASPYNDYDGESGTLSFAPGVTTQTIQIAIDDDNSVEATESFQLELENPTNALLGTETAVATIIDDDELTPLPIEAVLSLSDITIDEADGVATFQITLDRALDEALIVSYSTADGSALAGSDYTAQSGNLTFSAGDTVETVQIAITADDIPERSEYFELQIGEISGGGNALVTRNADSVRAYINADAEPQIIDDDTNYWNASIMDAAGNIIEPIEAQLYRSYYGALGRLPDWPGFEWWLGEVEAGRQTLQTMASGFIYSDEFKGLADSNQNGHVSSSELISHIYQNVFGRAASEGEVHWWAGEIDSGRRSQEGVFIDMTQSNEYVELTLLVVSQFEFL